MTIMNKDEKQAIIADYRRSDSDTGSPEVQVAILTKKINALTEHPAAVFSTTSSARTLTAISN